MTLKLYLLLVAGAAALFLIAPGIDIAVSAWFYRPGVGFELGWAPGFGVVRSAVPWMLVVAVLVATALFALNRARGTDWLQMRGRGYAFVLLSLALGPGLLANVILKDNWGRARPAHLVEFGGQMRFSPPLLMADQCAHNCAFVAGDAAAGFFLLAFALLARRRRGLAVAAALSVGVGLGIVRIIQGGHFLSDVVFAGLFVGGLIWGLHAAMMTPRGLALQSALGAGLAARARTTAGRLLLVGLTVGLLAALSMIWVDRPVAAWVQRLGPELHRLFSRTSTVGWSVWYLVGGALTVALCLAAAWRAGPGAARQRWQARAWVPGFVFLSIAVAGLTTDLAKSLLGRFRPKLYFRDGAYGFDFLRFQADYLSFPSGHATTGFALATALTLLWPRWGAVWYGIGLVACASRVLANAHWVSDVLAGALVGTLMTLYVREVLRAHGVAPAEALAGTARWQAPPTWRARLALPPRDPLARRPAA